MAQTIDEMQDEINNSAIEAEVKRITTAFSDATSCETPADVLANLAELRDGANALIWAIKKLGWVPK